MKRALISKSKLYSPYGDGTFQKRIVEFITIKMSEMFKILIQTMDLNIFKIKILFLRDYLTRNSFIVTYGLNIF